MRREEGSKVYKDIGSPRTKGGNPKRWRLLRQLSRLRLKVFLGTLCLSSQGIVFGRLERTLHYCFLKMGDMSCVLLKGMRHEGGIWFSMWVVGSWWLVKSCVDS